jgi:hypothetical protein
MKYARFPIKRGTGPNIKKIIRDDRCGPVRATLENRSQERFAIGIGERQKNAPAASTEAGLSEGLHRRS